MFGRIKKVVNETKYRMKLRSALQESTREQLQITLEEVKKEIERRNRKK